MKKLLFCACILSATASLQATEILKSSWYKTTENTIQKEFKVNYQGSDLNTSKADLDKLYQSLIDYVVKQKQGSSFSSVSFTTIVNAKEKQITITDIDFHADNSYAVALDKLLKSNTDKEIEITGIALEATKDQEKEDLDKAKELTNNTLKALNSKEYKPGYKLVCSIDINYQNIQ